jgi:hypothetical protein
MENEKLVVQTKELRQHLKELEHLHTMKKDDMSREISFLKTQYETGKSINNAEVTAKQRVKIEALEKELATLKHTKETDHADFLAHKLRLESNIAELQSNLANVEKSDHIKAWEAEIANISLQYNNYIFELETKLEWAMENQDIVQDCQKQIESVKLLNSTLIDKINSYEAPRAGKKSSFNETKKINELELKLMDSERENSRLKSNHGIGLENPRPKISDADYVRYLKGRLQIAEKEIELTKKQLQENLELMKQVN